MIAYARITEIVPCVQWRSAKFCQLTFLDEVAKPEKRTSDREVRHFLDCMLEKLLEDSYELLKLNNITSEVESRKTSHGQS